MNFSNPAKTFVEIARTLNELNRLASLLDPQNGNERWTALQEWLRKNPEKKQMIETAAGLEPAEALEYLLNNIGVELKTLKPYDEHGQIQKRAEIAISELQELYRERRQEELKVFDAKDGRRIKSPGKKRKQKVLDRQPKDYIDAEIVHE